ncbi:MAG: copper chaperone PCu(A)C [Polymorphobacter sp.]|uniref:copper chaperone PCu(A)C n=1 Tax=Polymorphobacter sp. TaxID=1909290 RepID=UPI003A83DA5D
MMKPLMIAALALLPLPALAAPAEDGIKKAWVRINPAPGRPAAGYFVMINGPEADALVAAEAPGARIELHTVAMTDGVMRMRPIDRLALAPGETVEFKSGGYHLMLFGLTAPGKTLPVTLVFDSGARRTVEAEVRMAGAGPR